MHLGISVGNMNLGVITLWTVEAMRVDELIWGVCGAVREERKDRTPGPLRGQR